MNNPFKEIFQFYEVPSSLKQKMLDNLKNVKTTINITDLFLLKYPTNFLEMMHKKLKND